MPWRKPSRDAHAAGAFAAARIYDRVKLGRGTAPVHRLCCIAAAATVLICGKLFDGAGEELREQSEILIEASSPRWQAR